MLNIPSVMFIGMYNVSLLCRKFHCVILDNALKSEDSVYRQKKLAIIFFFFIIFLLLLILYLICFCFAGEISKVFICLRE